MKEREVQDQNKTIWRCSQAFAGVAGKYSHQATAHIENKNDTVPVICTPSGGAQTVRLNLEHNWNDQLSDEDLVNFITKASKP